jgi:hypothetical protein
MLAFENKLDRFVKTSCWSGDQQLRLKITFDQRQLGDDRKTLFSMMDAFLRDAKARKAYA